MSAYDAVAPSFERHRALPGGVAEAIRAAVLGKIASSRPRLLDLGAGTGRIGRPFVAAGDDYVGVDLSLGMLREFIGQSTNGGGRAPNLVNADGERLPFADATFDIVMLIQVIGGARDWRLLVAESRRVLRSSGALVFGRTNMPDGGLDAHMKAQLALLLAEQGISSYHKNAHDRIRELLHAIGADVTRIVVDSWTADRTPREFIERQQTGARFSALPKPIKQKTLDLLSTWAAATFGSLDVSLSERHEFELLIFKFD